MAIALLSVKDVFVPVVVMLIVVVSIPILKIYRYPLVKNPKKKKELTEKKHTWGDVLCQLSSPHHPPLHVSGSGSWCGRDSRMDQVTG